MEFHSFDELSSAVKDYECANSVTLYTRSSRSVEAAKKRAPKCHFSEGLVYSELDCLCTRGERLKDSSVLSYSTLRDLFNTKVKQLGYPAEQFGLHSLRAGGASAAANPDVPDHLFKRHGRWKSENAKDGYVDDSVEKRLSVTKSLGL